MVVTARVMYVECFSGAAGDMLLGALIDAGLPLDVLRDALRSLDVRHEFNVSRVSRSGISATKVDVLAPADDHHHHGHHHPSEAHGHSHRHAHDHSHRSLAEITRLIDTSGLPARTRTRAIELFGRLGQAEADIHGIALDQVHFHEVGAVDSIVDIVGVVFGLEWFGIDDVVVSPLNVGGGTVEIAHGRYPVPAPATLRLLAGVPVYSGGPDVELVTPTGALLVSAYATSYGRMPSMTIDRAGYGAGSRDFAGKPNVVRVVTGVRTAESVGTGTSSAEGSTRTDTVLEIQCEIDDMNPQLFGAATDALFAAGALDVFLTSVQMKKGRPGTLVTVLAHEDAKAVVCDALFRNTTTLGLRIVRAERQILNRRVVEVATPGGTVRIKVSGCGDEILNAVPEFDDCARIAKATGRSVKDVQADALKAWFTRTTSS